MIDTIGCYNNIMSGSLCDRIIYAIKSKMNSTISPSFGNSSIILDEFGELGQELSHECLSSVHQKVVEYLPIYEFSKMISEEDIYCTSVRISKHSYDDINNILSCNRMNHDLLSNHILNWIMFLTEEDEDNVGGEIEIPLFNKRFKAVKGKMILFPTGISYYHIPLNTIKGTHYRASGSINVNAQF